MHVARILGVPLAVILGAFAVLLFAGPTSAAGHAKCGDASWYGPSGNLTASGEAYPTGTLTAAHKTAPFGTRFLVVRQDTMASVTVRINDRGPFTRGRIIDLNRSAAKQIGLKGVTKVCILEMPRSRLRRS